MNNLNILINHNNKNLADIVTLDDYEEIEPLKYKNLYIFYISDVNHEFNKVLHRLPKGWIPDVIILNQPYSLIPVDIDNYDIPIIAFIEDWNVAFEMLIYNLPRFDYIFTDKKGVELFKTLGYNNVEYWPLFPNKCYLIEGLEKIYDISFAGNMNHSIHYERVHYLKRLTRFSNKYKVRIASNLYTDDNYVRLLNQSKIVFNRTVRGEMNCRCFEAPSCGSLLFVEEENLEIRDFLEDKKECIYYNTNNLEELLEYYLTHEKEREIIAKAGYKKIQEFKQEKMWADLYSKIEKLLRAGKITRKKKFFNLSKSEQIKAIVSNVYNSGISNSIDFIRNKLEKQIHENNDIESLNNLAAILINILPKIKLKEFQEILKNQIIKYLELAIKEKYDYVIAHYNLGYIYFYIHDFEKSLKSFFNVINLLETDYIKGLSILGICFREFYDTFKIQWEKTYYDNISDNNKSLKSKSDIILAYTWEQIGDIYFYKNNIEKSLESYKKSFNIRSDLTFSSFKIAQLLENIDPEESIKYYEQAVKDYPLDLVISLFLCRYLYKIGRIEKCLEFCKECLLIVKTCDHLSKYKNDFNSIFYQCINEYTNKGINSFENKNYKQAIYYFENIMYNKNDLTNLFNLSLSYLGNKEYKKASVLLKELVENNNIDLNKICKNIGNLIYYHGRFELSHKILSLIRNNKILWDISEIKENKPIITNESDILKIVSCKKSHLQQNDSLLSSSKLGVFSDNKVNDYKFIVTDNPPPIMDFNSLIYRAYSKLNIDNLTINPYNIFAISDEIIEYGTKKGINQEIIFKVPLCIDMDIFSSKVLPFEIEGIKNFNFLTICNWKKSSSKLLELISHYNQYFLGNENVCLLIKFTDNEDYDYIINEINNIVDNGPDIIIIQENLNIKNLASIIARCDVYINLDDSCFSNFYCLCAGAMKKHIISFEKLKSKYFYSPEDSSVGEIMYDIFKNRNHEKENLCYLYIKQNHDKKVIGEKLVDILIKKEIYKILDQL